MKIGRRIISSEEEEKKNRVLEFEKLSRQIPVLKNAA
jgi:hypothetical protein